MCRPGLFCKDEERAEQTVRFALEVLRSLDDTNRKLKANLAARIGLNAGGPSIAGGVGNR
jgi:hypothetical protein